MELAFWNIETKNKLVEEYAKFKEEQAAQLSDAKDRLRQEVDRASKLMSENEILRKQLESAENDEKIKGGDFFDLIDDDIAEMTNEPQIFQLYVGNDIDDDTGTMPGTSDVTQIDVKMEPRVPLPCKSYNQENDNDFQEQSSTRSPFIDEKSETSKLFDGSGVRDQSETFPPQIGADVEKAKALQL